MTGNRGSAAPVLWPYPIVYRVWRKSRAGRVSGASWRTAVANKHIPRRRERRIANTHRPRSSGAIL